MKKYYTAISQQPEKSLKLIHYQNPGQSPVLEYGETHFPIIPLIANTAESGETVKIIAVKPAYTTTDYCLKVFQEELKAVSEKTGFSYELEVIDTPQSEVIGNHLDLFTKLVDSSSDGDQIYADITFGTKPIPMLMLMFMNFAYRCRKDTEIEAVIYGALNHEEKTASLYDVTALFFMNSVVNQFDSEQISDPAAVIRKLIDLGDAGE